MERAHTPAGGENDGSRDGSGAGDHDLPYQFGRRPHAEAPFPFTERQYCKLLVLRGRVAEAGDTQDIYEPRVVVVPDAVWTADAENESQAA